MISLALECSTADSSLALFRDGQLVADRSWTDDRRAGGGLFSVLPGFLQQADIALSDVDRFICGRGPGRFSSLRVAMTTATSAALPGDVEVYALSSGEALAAQVLASRPGPVTIAGDARRDTWWFATFSMQGGVLTRDEDWQVTPPSEFPDRVTGSLAIVSPDYTRLLDSPAWKADEALPALPWIEGPMSPSADHLGRQALARIEQGIPGEPPTPIYLHPPVAAPPPG